MSMPSDPAVYRGRLSDGRTAASMAVEARCTEAGVEIVAADAPGSTPLVWPYATLRSSVPLRADAPDVLVSQKPPGSATLFIADPAFSRSLALRAPALAPARQRLVGLRVGLTFVALVAVVAGAVVYFDLRPSRAVARLLPEPVRELMGRNVVAALTGRTRVCETPTGRAALERLTQRLAAAASDRPFPLTLTMVDWALPNAFMAPGGQLVLTRGLVQHAGSSDEVAGVLAHEIGHTLELHPEAGLVRSLALSLAGNVLIAGQGGNTSHLGVWLLNLSYSREAEREADLHALRILKAAGISAKGFGDFFDRVDTLFGKKAWQKLTPEQRKARERTGRMLSLVATHPLTIDRLAMVRAEPPYPATPALDDSDWRALQGMCSGTRKRRDQP